MSDERLLAKDWAGLSRRVEKIDEETERLETERNRIADQVRIEEIDEETERLAEEREQLVDKLCVIWDRMGATGQALAYQYAGAE